MRKLHLILTIGGGFLGIAMTLQAFFTATESKPLFYALLMGFVTLYGYGIFAGLRLADRPEDKKHLIVFYWLQVPWISSPGICYRFASGFHISGGVFESKLSGFFRLGSDWQFSFFQAAPWGVGINAFALAMAILLVRKTSNSDPVASASPTPPPSNQS